MAIIIISMLSY